MMELSNYSKMFKALSNEQRLRIFLMICNQSCVTEDGQKNSEMTVKLGSCCTVNGMIEKAFTKVCDCMNLSRSTISHHFKELQNAGLIICEREGKMFRCRINKEAIEALKKFFG